MTLNVLPETINHLSVKNNKLEFNEIDLILRSFRMNTRCYLKNNLIQLCLFQDGAEIDLVDKNGKTPLMLATGRKHLKVIEYLKKRLGAKNNMIPKIDIW